MTSKTWNKGATCTNMNESVWSSSVQYSTHTTESEIPADYVGLILWLSGFGGYDDDGVRGSRSCERQGNKHNIGRETGAEHWRCAREGTRHAQETRDPTVRARSILPDVLAPSGQTFGYEWRKFREISTKIPTKDWGKTAAQATRARREPGLGRHDKKGRCRCAFHERHRGRKFEESSRP